MELIEKLDEEAWECANKNSQYESRKFGVIRRERFAELIIRECHLSVNKYINDYGEVSNFPIEILLKHFGLNDD